MANGPELKKYISTRIPSYSLTVKKYENIFRSEKKFWKKFHTIEIYSHRSGKREKTIFFYRANVKRLMNHINYPKERSYQAPRGLVA